MRWRARRRQHGDIEIVHRFLFLPMTIGKETRWLEWAYIERKWRWVTAAPYGWHAWWAADNLRFADEVNASKTVPYEEVQLFLSNLRERRAKVK